MFVNPLLCHSSQRNVWIPGFPSVGFLLEAWRVDFVLPTHAPSKCEKVSAHRQSL